MVGWFDAVEKGNALRYCGFDEIVINKLDALSAEDGLPTELKICVAYKLPGGEITKDVPRLESIRKSLSPVYEILPGWSQNLSSIKSFSDFPIEAQRYVAKMASSMIGSAYPDGYKNRILPKFRFVGVGPNPGQIVSDIPSTMDLIKGF